MIRGDDDESDRVLEDEECRKEFELLCKEVLNEICDDDGSEGKREKLLLDIFELSGMAAMTDLNEAYDKVMEYNDTDMNDTTNDSGNVFFDESNRQLIIFCDDLDTNQEELCFTTLVVKVSDERISVESVDEGIEELESGSM